MIARHHDTTRRRKDRRRGLSEVCRDREVPLFLCLATWLSLNDDRRPTRP